MPISLQFTDLKEKMDPIEYVNKFDGEYPNDKLDEVLEYLDCSIIEFNENIDKHRNKEIWTLKGNEHKLSFKIK